MKYRKIFYSTLEMVIMLLLRVFPLMGNSEFLKEVYHIS